MNALLVLDYYVWKIFITRIRPSWFKSKLLSALSLIYIAFFPLPRKFLLHFFRGTGNLMKVDTRDVVLRNQRVLAYLKKTLDEQKNTGAAGKVNSAHGQKMPGQLEKAKLENTQREHAQLKIEQMEELKLKIEQMEEPKLKNGQMEIGALEHAKTENVETEDRRLRIFIGQHMVSNPIHRYSIGSLHLVCQPEQDMVHIRLEAQYRFSGNNDRLTRYLHQQLNAHSEKRGAANFNIEGTVWTLSMHALMSSEVFPRHRKYIDYNILYI